MKYYVYLLKNIKRIKKRVCKSNHVLKRKAVVSHNCYSGARNVSTMDQMIKILALKYADDMLKSLYTAALESLKQLGKDAVLLLKWYSYDADRKQIANDYGCSTRTLYRKTKVLLGKFQRKMINLGYDQSWFEEQKIKLGLCD